MVFYVMTTALHSELTFGNLFQDSTIYIYLYLYLHLYLSIYLSIYLYPSIYLTWYTLNQDGAVIVHGRPGKLLGSPAPEDLQLMVFYVMDFITISVEAAQVALVCPVESLAVGSC